MELKAENNPTLDKVDMILVNGLECSEALCNSAGLHTWFDPKGVLIVVAQIILPRSCYLCCMKTVSEITSQVQIWS
ncbi:hypothetical protein [Pasteurella multocida]|uniref:hypothetical protein n=1 Tax=Pasteurella multocida TaxID=747 RepID=UPI001E609988|nr:hypothetical protein [Pasteurella multocida]